MAFNLEKQTHKRFESLDGLRGIAAIFVALGHIQLAGIYSERFYLAVDFFFILSGFILSHRYFEKWDSKNLKLFIWKRWVRLAPLHLFVTIVFLAYTYDTNSPITDQISWRVLNSLLLTNTLGFGVPTINPAAWSISAEFIVNILFAVFLVKRTALIGLLALLSYVSLYHNNPNLNGIYQNLFLFGTQGLFRCFGGFLIGILIHKFFQIIRSANISYYFLTTVETFVIVTIMVTILLSDFIKYTDYIIIFLFASLILIVSLDKSVFAGLLKSPPLTFIGKISYSIYLTHFLISYIIRDHLYLFNSQLLALAFYVMITGCVSYFTWKTIENFCLKKFYSPNFDNVSASKIPSYSLVFMLVAFLCVSGLGAVSTIQKERQKVKKLLNKVQESNRSPIPFGAFQVYQFKRTFIIQKPNCVYSDRHFTANLYFFKNSATKISSKSVNLDTIFLRFNESCVKVVVAPKGTKTMKIKVSRLRGQNKDTAKTFNIE